MQWRIPLNRNINQLKGLGCSAVGKIRPCCDEIDSKEVKTSSKMLYLVVSSVIFGLTMAQIDVNMGSGSTLCGEAKFVKREDKINIFSKGSAKDGVCTFVANAMDDTTDECPYRAFCVAVTSSSLSNCVAKVFLTGTSYDLTGQNTKELSCYSNIYGAWCTQSKTLMISVLEDPKSPSTSYGFNMTVLSECRNKPVNGEFQTVSNNNSKKLQDIEEAINQNRVVGVVVGVCLACVFLVILFISYNYYKNKPTYRQQRDI